MRLNLYFKRTGTLRGKSRPTEERSHEIYEEQVRLRGQHQPTSKCLLASKALKFVRDELMKIHFLEGSKQSTCKSLVFVLSNVCCVHYPGILHNTLFKESTFYRFGDRA